MRPSLWMVGLSLLATPVFAQNNGAAGRQPAGTARGAAITIALPAGEKPGGQRISPDYVVEARKYTLTRQEPQFLVRALSRATSGPALGFRELTAVTPGAPHIAITPVASDNSLVVQAPAAIAQDFPSALSVVDVALEGEGSERLMTVILRRADPKAIAAAAQQFDGSGMTLVTGKTMRFKGSEGWLQGCLGLVFLAELPEFSPVVGSGPSAAIKVAFQNQDVSGWLQRVRAAAPATLHITPLPLENAFAARGDVDGLGALSTALTVIDTPIERTASGEKITIRLVRADPDATLQKINALYNAGSAQRDERTLIVEGKPDWIRAALGIAFRAEIAAGSRER